MSRIPGNVLLVGSIYREVEDWSVEQTLIHCAQALDKRASMLPDGEPGDRQWWVTFLAYRVMYPNPDLEVVTRPDPDLNYLDRDIKSGETEEHWLPTSYLDMWRFKSKEGVTQITFPELGYARDAKASYATFKVLRESGVIAPETRFQVCLPLAESAMRQYITNQKDYELVWKAFDDAMKRELALLLEAVPAQDLSIQWDAACETVGAAGNESFSDYPGKEWQADGTPFGRFRDSLASLSPHIPEEVWLGVHLCYGSLGHRFAVELTDMSVNVELANMCAKHSGRRMDFIHMPVSGKPERQTKAFYAPLADLDVGEDTRLYFGLVKYDGGVPETLERAARVREHVPDFGIGTACGFARRPNQQDLDTLLRIHAEAADKL